MLKRVLVVDDNIANLRLFELLLRSAYDVQTVTNAREAAAMVDRWKPHLILMDVGLPDVDGLTLARKLRGEDLSGALRIVALTAYATREDRDRALAAGCDGFIAKPIDTRTFSTTIEQHLQ